MVPSANLKGLLAVALTLIVSISPIEAARGVTTRYWDCCKPSCAWPDKARVSRPVLTCNRQDQMILDALAPSACGGSDVAYTCSNNAPWAINDNLSYGFAAAKLLGKSEWDWCCACYK
jgi:hypothetical protein